jgi:signal transduction histidine kinase/ActR/RegA family two-component response regulator
MAVDWRANALDNLPKTDSSASALLRKLTDYSVMMLKQDSLDDIIWNIVDYIGDKFGFEDCVLYLNEPEGLVQMAAYGLKNPKERSILHRIVIPHGQGIVGTCAELASPVRIDDVAQDSRYIFDVYSGRSELSVPITFEDRVLGVLDSESKAIAFYDDTDEALFVAIATLSAPRIASALAQKRAAEAESALAEALEAQRRQEENYQTESLESLGLLAGGIAHDFNNLLTAILGNISLAHAHVSENSTFLLEEAEQACLRAKGLTKQLLTFSRGGQPVLQQGDLLSLLLKLGQFTARSTQLKLDFDFPDSLPPCAFDAGQIAQICQNLILNAAQACAGTLHISGELEKKTCLVKLRFHDDGPGVPLVLQHRIFTPYFSTKDAGTGVGLATSYWIARRHGGKLELDTAVTHGACFVLTLPVGNVAEQEIQDTQEGETPKTLRILVMEDEEAIQRVLSRSLASLGYQADSVEDGKACIERYRQQLVVGDPYDLVLLDLTVPGGMGGQEAMRRLLELDANARGVVASGYSGNPVLAQYQDYGFRACLEKPFTCDDLQQALAKAVSRT